MAEDYVPRTYYLRRQAETVQGDDQSPENPGPPRPEAELPVPVINISCVSDVDTVTVSQELGKRQVVEVKSSVLSEISAADLLRICDDAEDAGVVLQITVIEDRDRS